MAIACSGHRVIGQGHHQTTFETLVLAMGNAVQGLAAYFETCRRKRNTVDYDTAFIVATTEADELLAKATELSQLVEDWIARRYPSLAP